MIKIKKRHTETKIKNYGKVGIERQMKRWKGGKWRGRDELQSRQPLGQIAAWIPPNDTLSHHRTGTLSEAHPQSAAATGA